MSGELLPGQTCSEIQFKRVYLYELTADLHALVPVFGHVIDHPFIKLDTTGRLTVKRGYSWDGATFAFDKGFEPGSATHDALYQLMREGLIARSWRRAADRAMKTINLEKGMHPIRAWYTWVAVRCFAFWAVW